MVVFFSGLILGFSLIMSLGPQNIFLIKQGAKKNHAGLSAMVCFFCDLILISSSVIGLHHLFDNHPGLRIGMLWLGSAFLLVYAIKTLYAAFKPSKNSNDPSHTPYSRKQIILLALGFSLLNPYAIIDTLVIIGSGSSQFPDHQLLFSLGVISASFLWFSSLSFTAQRFSSVLSKNKIWRLIEFFGGTLMLFIGIKLALSGLQIK